VLRGLSLYEMMLLCAFGFSLLSLLCLVAGWGGGEGCVWVSVLCQCVWLVS